MPVVSWFRRSVPVLGLALLLAGCAFDGPRSALSPIGPVAQVQMDLFMWSFWLSMGVLALVSGVLIFVLIRYRHRGDESGLPKQVHGSVLLEAIWTAIPVVIIILIAVPTVRVIFETEAHVTPGDDDVVVNVTGYQWWWKFEYPQYGVVTANELHIPVGKRIILNLDSADVVHAFWAPQLAGKRDLIPNQDNQLWFVAEQTGTTLGHCAELCLGAHAYMRFQVVISEEEEFDAWVEAFQQVQQPQLAASPAPQLVQADPQVQAGKQLFAQKGCAACHSVGGYAEGATIGNPNYPDLTNFGLRNTVGAAVLPNTPENLAQWLRDPQSVKPGNYMPTLWSEDDPQREEQISAIVAYLLSLGRESQPIAQADALMGGLNGTR